MGTSGAKEAGEEQQIGRTSRRSTAECSSCGQPAALSLAFHVSTLGVTPRKQKTTASERVCRRCIQALLVEGGSPALTALLLRLRGVYTEFGGNPMHMGDERQPKLFEGGDELP